ncbi:hypothetical protein BaRGS_00033565, partial [Batillaria attramentaria]
VISAISDGWFCDVSQGYGDVVHEVKDGTCTCIIGACSKCMPPGLTFTIPSCLSHLYARVSYLQLRLVKGHMMLAGSQFCNIPSAISLHTRLTECGESGGGGAHSFESSPRINTRPPAKFSGPVSHNNVGSGVLIGGGNRCWLLQHTLHPRPVTS